MEKQSKQIESQAQKINLLTKLNDEKDEHVQKKIAAIEMYLKKSSQWLKWLKWLKRFKLLKYF